LALTDFIEGYVCKNKMGNYLSDISFGIFNIIQSNIAITLCLSCSLISILYNYSINRARGVPIISRVEDDIDISFMILSDV